MANRVELVSKQKMLVIFLSFWTLWLGVLFIAYYASLKKHLQLPYFDAEKVKHSGLAVSALGVFSVSWLLSYCLLKPSQSRECCTLEAKAGLQTGLGSFLFTSLGAAYLYVEQPQLVKEIPELPRFVFCLAAAAGLLAAVSMVFWLVCCYPRQQRERAEGEPESFRGQFQQH